MEKALVEGAATAAKTKVAKMTKLRASASYLALMTPTTFNISTTTRIGKATPKSR